MKKLNIEKSGKMRTHSKIQSYKSFYNYVMAKFEIMQVYPEDKKDNTVYLQIQNFDKIKD